MRKSKTAAPLVRDHGQQIRWATSEILRRRLRWRAARNKIVSAPAPDPALQLQVRRIARHQVIIAAPAALICPECTSQTILPVLGVP
jgi:hypothetical protein